jgi:hypothetical protein
VYASYILKLGSILTWAVATSAVCIMGILMIYTL